MSNIIKINSIENVLGSAMTIYIIWDSIKQNWHIDYTEIETPYLGRGVYINEKRAISIAEKYKLKDYEIVDICFKDRIPDDIIRVKELDLGTDPIISKLRQMFRVFIFQNEDLKEQMKNKFNSTKGYLNDNNSSS